jgi:phosphopantetheinyl transferase (holo-ACP synthase)
MVNMGRARSAALWAFSESQQLGARFIGRRCNFSEKEPSSKACKIFKAQLTFRQRAFKNSQHNAAPRPLLGKI